ncbi:PTS sugar transporter subunit IIA [Anaerostipes sp.]|uniref:PTS sugar transporter subunit IIA n=1 Tax=Anaerostipes sp. TaxID=1872530 RepID=UPI0025889187|nr:PTS sugar transporter subunit IIA [Anaerostipes sp.]MCI5623314.1 PTS sugar transporter subunit IIA [Anaerostipes sp.]MDY2726829.1 PTS sugar transporter subunit IIA [Anaerostipes faecalis]
MVGLVVVSHGDLSKGLASSIALIAGEYKNMITLSLEKNDNAEEFHNEILNSVKKVDEGDGVIIFTDVLGGTPSNLSTLVARRNDLFCLTGMNLPMLIEFVMLAEDDLPLKELAERCLEAAAAGIRMTNKI